jgi:hypothetical protein
MKKLMLFVIALFAVFTFIRVYSGSTADMKQSVTTAQFERTIEK